MAVAFPPKISPEIGDFSGEFVGLGWLMKLN